MTQKTTQPFLSIVIPVYNEEENVRPLFEKIRSVCEAIGDTYELLFVDDGSVDNTFTKLAELHKETPFLRVIRFEKNAGQTVAMAAGFEFARGERIISMDGDLQNDPVDIPNLLAKLDEGYDLVCGWRKERQDKMLTRRLPSVIANWMIAKVTGVEIHDNGCSLKAYQAQVIKQVNLYGEMHRFIPAMSTVVGARIAEIVVTHHPRRFGKSKYGLGRIWRVMIDIIAFKFIISVFAQCSKNQKPSFIGRCLHGFYTRGKLGRLTRFFIFTCKRRPLRFFGLIGAILFLLGGVLLLRMPNINFVPVLSIFLFITGILIFCFGIFGELLMFANAKHIKDYTVKTDLKGKR